MKNAIRQVLLLTVSALFSWWVFLYAPEDRLAPPDQTAPEAAPLNLLPITDPLPSKTAPASPSAPTLAESGSTEIERAPDEERIETPPPAELGDPDAGESENPKRVASAEPNQEDSPPNEDLAGADVFDETEASQPEALMRDKALLALARDELSGESSQGFETILLASTEQQLEIARFFDEELVMIPKGFLDESDDDPHYFRLSADPAPKVERVKGRPALESYRQYRDFFDYDYSRLPAPIRELRRSVLDRKDIYLFGALISAKEWAVVIARRREALASSGRRASEVRQYTLRYIRQSSNRIDVVVEEILFTDGERYRPSPTEKGILK